MIKLSLPLNGRYIRCGMNFMQKFEKNWWQLRSVGNLKFLKISYIALVAIPFLNQHKIVIDFLGIRLWFLSTVFFGSVFLALANLIYDICCPEIVKRFSSPNDLYFKMLKIKELSVNLYASDNFRADLNHCIEAYENASITKPFIRMTCSLFYIGSGVLFLVVLGYRVLKVAKDMII